MSKNILIIEDEQLIGGLLEKSIKKGGYAATWVTSAEEGLKCITAEHFDLILLDLVLPGMHGFDFLKIIKNDDRFKKIPVIIASNLGAENEIQQGLALGAVAYIVKSDILPEDIIMAIQKTLIA